MNEIEREIYESAKCLDEIRDLTVTWPAFVKFARDVVFKKKMVFEIEMTEFRDAGMLWKRNRNGAPKLLAVFQILSPCIARHLNRTCSWSRFLNGRESATVILPIL